MLLNTLVKERMEGDYGREGSKIKVKLLENLFKMFPVNRLVDSDFHTYLFTFIKKD
jgi:hypothetical protein